MLEDKPHFVVADLVRVQIDCCKLLRNQVEQVGFLQLLQPPVKGEMLEHLAGVGGELGDVVFQVGAGAGGAHAVQGKLRDVVEGCAGRRRQDQVHVHATGLHRPILAAYLAAGGFQHTFQTTQHGERKDDAAVLGGLEGSQKQICDIPDEGGQGLLVHAHVPYTEAGRACSPHPCEVYVINATP
ncbi:hypothetical protein D3C73_1050170 [compost metagenome]